MKGRPLKSKAKSIEVHQADLPDGLDFGDIVAVDTETQGLRVHRDRLCLVQVSAGDGHCHLVQFPDADYRAPNLKALFQDAGVTKIFHYARFDVATIRKYLNVACAPVYCTKIASRLARTYTGNHVVAADNFVDTLVDDQTPWGLLTGGLVVVVAAVATLTAVVKARRYRSAAASTEAAERDSAER